MMKRSSRYYLLHGIVISTVALICLISYAVTTSLTVANSKKQENLEYVSYEVLTDNRLAEYIKFPNLTKEEELECIKDWIKNADDSKYEKWVITLKSDNTPIGNISVNGIEKRHNYCNVGYVILYAYWGKGYASEALKVVSDYLLESGYYLVECSCNELNKQSSRVMEKAGFKKDGYIANRRLNKDGTYSGVEYYSKTK